MTLLLMASSGWLVPSTARPRSAPIQLAGFGFGAAPAAPKTLDEVVKSFGHRLPKDFGESCACGSGESYSSCCRAYHVGDKKAESPERCLRARYSAFAYRLPKYIIESTDKSNKDYMKDHIKWAKKLSKTAMFDTFDFSASKLGVGEVVPGKDENTVHMDNSFTLQPKNPVGAPPVVTYERTTFVRRSAGWLFADGAVTSEEAGLRKRDAMRGERDVEKLKSDVEYAKVLVSKIQKKDQGK